MKTKIALLTALSLAGCAAGPDYHMPALSAAQQAPLLGAPITPGVIAGEPAGDWWKLYDDPTLTQLVQDAIAANTDLRVAVARLERARASLRRARSDNLPQTSIGASGSYRRVPEVNAFPGADRQDWLIDGGLSVGYEVDLFGRVKRNIEAARGDVAAAAADADVVRVAIVADTIRAYVDAASSAERLDVANRSVELLDRSVRVTTSRFQAGRSAKLDVLRITALREQQRERVPEIEAERQAALFRLATLTGRAPSELPLAAGERKTTPVITQPIPIGDGGSLLARRPDVRAAERRLAAATARIGVATSDLYPHISLGGSVGSSSTGFSDLFGGGPLRFLAGPLISWNFPNLSSARARIAETKADTQGSLAAFDGTLLRALEETESALNAYAKALDRQAALKGELDAAQAAVRIVRGRQREGTVDFLTVIDAERTAADASADLAQADARVAFAQVDLFRALGGGWQKAPPKEAMLIAPLPSTNPPALR